MPQGAAAFTADSAASAAVACQAEMPLPFEDDGDLANGAAAAQPKPDVLEAAAEVAPELKSRHLFFRVVSFVADRKKKLVRVDHEMDLQYDDIVVTRHRLRHCDLKSHVVYVDVSPVPVVEDHVSYTEILRGADFRDLVCWDVVDSDDTVLAVVQVPGCNKQDVARVIGKLVRAGALPRSTVFASVATEAGRDPQDVADLVVRLVSAGLLAHRPAAGSASDGVQLTEKALVSCRVTQGLCNMRRPLQVASETGMEWDPSWTTYQCLCRLQRSGWRCAPTDCGVDSGYVG